ncbi:MAG: hypothetical protein JZU65_19045 [Chlorobium sp.]|nr:hypothetical protein [Chlorobium sp.]
MKLFAKTLTDFLIKTIRPVIKGHTGGKELRVFLSSQPPKIIYETAKEVSEFLQDHPSIQLEFKVGTALWESWDQTSLSPYDKSCVEKIKTNGWVDLEDQLTHYRNLSLTSGSGYDFLVIILVGVDLARDQASLQDFFTVDSNSIWDGALNKSFKSWIRKTYQDQKDIVYSNDEHVEAADDLLKVLHKIGAGDLLQVSDFLEKLDLNGLPDGNAALKEMYWGLNFWDLPKLQDMSFRSREKWTDYVQDARRFFSYQDLLNNAERQKVLKNIDWFVQLYRDERVAYPLADNDEFKDLQDLLSCLQKYVSSNCLASRSRLLRTDFAPILDTILKVRKPRAKTSPPAMTKIDAPPLEAVLSALWIVLIDYKKGCTKANILPASALRKISLEGIKFRNDDDGLDLIKGCLGGLDVFLQEKLIIEVVVDGEEINVPVESKLLPEDLETLRLEKSGASVPGFQFKIVFQAEPDDLTIDRKFQWQVPETHAYRNLWNLTKEVRRQLPDAGACLPVFTMPHYEEIFLASDEEEANRILKLGHEDLRVVNLLDFNQINTNDSLFSKFGNLSHYWGKFLKSLDEEGYFHALGDPWVMFSKTYLGILKSLVSEKHVGLKNQFAPLLYKAFSIISIDESKSPFTQYLQSAVLTGLHPALFEMLNNRETFLIHGFLEKSRKIINDSSGLKISLKNWNSVCDLATIKFPLFGLVADANKKIDTNIKSLGLIHCVGSPTQTSSPLSAKIILRSDEIDDEEMSDANLFRESSESRVIKRLLDEYIAIYPHAKDGLSLAVINAENVQTIIAGIDDFLKNRDDDINSLSPPYHFSLTLFTLDNHQQEATKHLQEWRKRWEVVNDSTSKFGYYNNCRLSIAHRIANDINLGIDDYLKLVSRNEFVVDLAILANFITVGDRGSDVEIANTFRHILDEHLLKFPIVEMPRCSDEHPAQVYVRAKVISNRRFRLATLHSELGAYFKHPGYPIGQEYIVISEGDYDRWRNLIDKLHERATWVFCLDSAMDESLAAGQEDAVGKKRGIIGFSSGLGLRGELNYTISTERSSLAEIEKKIAKLVSDLCGIREKNLLKQSARFLVSKASELSGLSLIRATGPGERHIRELIASTLVRISLPKTSQIGLCLCDELISLDAFIHWFDNAASPNRPDLLRIVAILQDDGVIVINAHMVECKLAQQNSVHLDKARIQLESGLRHLMTVFQPNYDGADNAVFDQRYWWAQLQRLVASKSRVPSEDQRRVTHALESLGEGNYRICWQAMAVVFWTDRQTTFYENDRSWEFFFRDQQLAIDVISAGAGIIAPLCSMPGENVLPCSNEAVCFPPDTHFNEPKKTEGNNGAHHAPESPAEDIPSIKGYSSVSENIPHSSEAKHTKPFSPGTKFSIEDKEETFSDDFISPELEVEEPIKLNSTTCQNEYFLEKQLVVVKKKFFGNLVIHSSLIGIF